MPHYVASMHGCTVCLCPIKRTLGLKCNSMHDYKSMQVLFYGFLNYDACLLANFFYIFVNSVDPDEMPHNAAFICVFTVCQSTCWQVGIWQVSRMKRLTILKLKVYFILPAQISFINVILHPHPLFFKF